MLSQSDEQIALEDYFRHAEITYLYEDTTHTTIGGIQKIQKRPSEFIVLDDIGETLVAYRTDGHVRYTFNKVGNGHHEYEQILDFDTDDSLIYCLCFPYKIMVLNSVFHLVDEIKLDEEFSKICIDRGNIYLYSELKRKLFRMNKQQKKELLHEEPPLPSLPTKETPIFYKVDDGLLYSSLGSDTIYTLEDNTLTPFITLDYPLKEELLARYSREGKLSRKEKMEKDHPAITSILKISRGYMIIYTGDFVYRVCMMSYDGDVIKDGVLHGFLPSPTLQVGDKYIAEGFLMDSNFFDRKTSLQITPKNPYKDSKGHLYIMEYQE
jgi:hypothetical protein